MKSRRNKSNRRSLRSFRRRRAGKIYRGGQNLRTYGQVLDLFEEIYWDQLHQRHILDSDAVYNALGELYDVGTRKRREDALQEIDHLVPRFRKKQNLENILRYNGIYKEITIEQIVDKLATLITPQQYDSVMNNGGFSALQPIASFFPGMDVSKVLKAMIALICRNNGGTIGYDETKAQIVLYLFRYTEVPPTVY